MRTDNFLLIGSFFLPQFRKTGRLPKIFTDLKAKRLTDVARTINEQVKDLETLRDRKLSIDYHSFVMLLLLQEKSLSNRFQTIQLRARNLELKDSNNGS